MAVQGFRPLEVRCGRCAERRPDDRASLLAVVVMSANGQGPVVMVPERRGVSARRHELDELHAHVLADEGLPPEPRGSEADRSALVPSPGGAVVELACRRCGLPAPVTRRRVVAAFEAGWPTAYVTSQRRLTRSPA